MLFRKRHDRKGSKDPGGGSGFGEAVTGLQPSAPGATIKEGKLLNGRQTVESLKAWAETV